MNERIAEITRASAGSTSNGDVFDFICECDDAACAAAITLTLAELERVHAVRDAVIVAPGHEPPRSSTLWRAKGAVALRVPQLRSTERSSNGTTSPVEPPTADARAERRPVRVHFATRR